MTYHYGGHHNRPVLQYRAVVAEHNFTLDQDQLVDIIPVADLERGRGVRLAASQ